MLSVEENGHQNILFFSNDTSCLLQYLLWKCEDLNSDFQNPYNNRQNRHSLVISEV